MPTVIIIDDQFTSRLILEELMHTVGDTVEVQTFNQPANALEWASDNRADLVLTDFKMPGTDGIEFTRRLRQIDGYRDVPIVLISVISDDEVRELALAAGVTDLLEKPVDHHHCRARCRELLFGPDHHQDDTSERDGPTHRPAAAAKAAHISTAAEKGFLNTLNRLRHRLLGDAPDHAGQRIGGH